MERFEILMHFFSASEADFRIGKGHLALFSALYIYWSRKGFPDPFRVYGYQVMLMAKISANSTYNRLLNDLKDFGYLRYEASYYKGKGSSITFYNSQGFNGETENTMNDP